MNNLIDISKKDKTEVLMALYDGAKPQGLGFLHFDPKPMSKEEAQELLRNQTYFDYLKGRVMKVDLSRNHFSPTLYDRDNGEGAAARAVATVPDIK